MSGFYAYILQSDKTGRFYIGSTQDLQSRLMRHNRGFVRSTKSGTPWKLVFSECFDSRELAVRRELEIKKQKSRKYIIGLLDKNEM